MTIQAGDRLPAVTFTTMTADGPKPVTTDAFFKGRRVALFSVPGAFTPTCSARHLPGFLDKADALMAKGVDVIACTAVNDVFVMAAWAEAQQVGDRVTMLADGNGDFAAAIGLSADRSQFGMGRRGQRWSALVKDGVVEILNVEQNGFEVSSAEYLLDQIQSQ
jgi:glutaredoxin/glutathione-dependent peroxiredoxin